MTINGGRGSNDDFFSFDTLVMLGVVLFGLYLWLH
jgi:hypothetical protein